MQFTKVCNLCVFIIFLFGFTVHLLLSLVIIIHFMYNAKIWNSQVLLGDSALPLILPF